MRPHRRQPTRLRRPWDSPGKNTGVGCHFLLQCMKVKIESEVAQSCPTFSDPMDCSLPGFSVHGIFQARVLEWGAIAFSIFWGPFKIEVAYRKEWNNAICSNMDGPRDDYTKWIKSGRERQTSCDITFMWNLKCDTYELIYKTETDSQTENKLMVTKGEMWSGGGRNWESRINI